MNPSILAAEYVADTVALIVYLENRRLGADSQQFSIQPKTPIRSFTFPRLFSPKFSTFPKNNASAQICRK